MADEGNQAGSAAPAPAEAPAATEKSRIERTVLRPYPKVVFFYLTWIAALVCGIVTSITADGESAVKTQGLFTYIFLWVFTFNLLVVSFEFSRMLSVSIFLFSLAVVFLGMWLGFLDGFFEFLGNIQPHADPAFFFFVFIVFTVIYLFVFFQTRFNYWVVRRNELLHKHGFLGDVKRYHAQGVKLDKEIPDILEFMLLRSGSMVLHVEHESRAIVLENIIGINKKEEEVKSILESYAVRIENND